MKILNGFVTSFSGLPTGTQVLWASWILSMITLPIATWLWGASARKKVVTINVFLQAATVIAILGTALNTLQTVIIVAIVLVLGWAVEFVGSRTGIPFSPYHYTDELQPQLGHVPIVIPFAWLMMLPPAWAVGSMIVGATSGWAFILVSALAFTAWDLFLDPQMVKWGFWAWDSDKTTLAKGAYFGIPLLNFFGWFLASMGITYVVTGYAAHTLMLPNGPLFLVYGLTWMLETVCQLVFCGLPGSAVGGFIGMGLFVWIAVSAL